MRKNVLVQINKLFLNKKNIIFVLLCFMLVSILASIAMPLSASEMDETRENKVKERLENILSTREFQDEIENRSFLNDIGKFIKESIKKIFQWIKDFVNNNKYTGPELPAIPFIGEKIAKVLISVLKILGILVIPAIIIFLLYFVSKNVRISKRKKVLEDAELLVSTKDPDSLLAMALNCKDKGDYRQALRFLYLSMLVEYNKQNIIRINKSKTNRQYLYEIRQNNPASFDKISEFTTAFNEHWYGGRALYLENFEFWYTEYSRLIEGGKR